MRATLAPNGRTSGVSRSLPHILPKGPFSTPKGLRGAKAAGVRYEKKVREGLPDAIRALGLEPSFGVWVAYDGGLCQLDVLCLPPGLHARLFPQAHLSGESLPPTGVDPSLPVRPMVLEAKLSHTLGAWHQLVDLYGPVVHALTGEAPRLVEVTRSYTPLSEWPEEPQVIRSLADAPESGVGIYSWGFL